MPRMLLLPFYRDILGLKAGWRHPGSCLGTDDLMGECGRLKRAGVEFVEEPKDYGDVWVATFKDPEGKLLQLLAFKRAT